MPRRVIFGKGCRSGLNAGAGALAVSVAGIGIPAAITPTAADAATTPVVSASMGGWSHLTARPAWILIGSGNSPFWQ